MNIVCEKIKSRLTATPVEVGCIRVLATPGSNLIEVAFTSEKTGKWINGFSTQLDSCVKG